MSQDDLQLLGAPGAPLPSTVIGRSLVQSDRRGGRKPAIGLTAVWPELLRNVPACECRVAERTLMMPLLTVDDADLAEVMGSQSPAAFYFLIADGVVLKETALAQNRALELLGPGDLLPPPPSAAGHFQSGSVSRYLAHGHVSLAAIDARFGLTARRWPAIADVLHEQLGQQIHRASMHAAMLHLPRVEDRLVAFFADLAERFGRVNTSGIVVDMPLTHELLGGLVGSRRPTVTLALRELASLGVIERRDGNRWILSHSVIHL